MIIGEVISIYSLLVLMHDYMMTLKKHFDNYSAL